MPFTFYYLFFFSLISHLQCHFLREIFPLISDPVCLYPHPILCSSLIHMWHCAICVFMILILQECELCVSGHFILLSHTAVSRKLEQCLVQIGLVKTARCTAKYVLPSSWCRTRTFQQPAQWILAKWLNVEQWNVSGGDFVPFWAKALPQCLYTLSTPSLSHSVWPQPGRCQQYPREMVWKELSPWIWMVTWNSYPTDMDSSLCNYYVKRRKHFFWMFFECWRIVIL